MDNYLDKIERHNEISGKKFAAENIEIKVLPPLARINLRVAEQGIKDAEQNFEIALPQAPNKSEIKASRAALWLGPDEWLLVDMNSSWSPNLADEGNFYGVDLSHHFCGVQIKGLASRQVLATNCPQDLRAENFGKGACARTIFGKATVIIHCINDDEFVVHFQRSFAEYVWQLFEVSAKTYG